jgi:hypothetical protein
LVRTLRSDGVLNRAFFLDRCQGHPRQLYVVRVTHQIPQFTHLHQNWCWLGAWQSGFGTWLFHVMTPSRVCLGFKFTFFYYWLENVIHMSVCKRIKIKCRAFLEHIICGPTIGDRRPEPGEEMYTAFDRRYWDNACHTLSIF